MLRKYFSGVLISTFIIHLAWTNSFCAEGGDRHRQLILLGGNSKIRGDVGEVMNDTISGGLGFRLIKSEWGAEILGSYADFDRKKTSDFNLDSDIRILTGEVSGLYYFGSPTQLRGFAKLGTGIARSKVNLTHATETPKSQDPLAVVGIGVDFGLARKFGGLIEFDFRQIFMKGEDIKTASIIAGLSYNW